MKTRRVFPILFLLLSFELGIRAQNAVEIYQIDGKVTTFAFSEKPVVTYSGSDLVMTTTKTTVQYPIYLLKKISFDVELDDADVVKDVKADEQFSFRGGTITVMGGEPNSQVYIFNIQGLKAGHYKLDDQGNASIPVSGLASGFYVLKTKRFTFKFRKS